MTLDAADQMMATLEDILAFKIKIYRDLAVSTYMGEAIVKRVEGSPIFGNTVVLPSDTSAQNMLYLKRTNDVVGGLNFLLVSIALQRFILSFLASFSDLFYSLLIASLVIRLVPPLKDAGDFMFVFTLAIFLILPSMYIILISPFNLGLPQQICNDLSSLLPPGFSYTFFTPIASCFDVGLIAALNVYAIFIPNIAYGLTFSFASNFKKFFDIFEGAI